jgi:hypothetical protein
MRERCSRVEPERRKTGGSRRSNVFMAAARRRCIAQILSHACIPHEQILDRQESGDGNTCMKSTVRRRNTNGAQFATSAASALFHQRRPGAA